MANTDIQDICKQRAARMLLTPPLVRMELTSPYVTPSPYTSAKNQIYTPTPFSSFQLNMRRKTEILKYSSQSQSTQTNNQTKQQRWAQIARGNTEKKFTYNPVTQIATVNSCVNDKSIPTPTSACDVPGPIVDLYEDAAVPLYLYAFNTRSNPNNQNTSTDPWYTRTYPDQVFTPNVFNQAVTIAITQYNTIPSLSIPIQIPLSIHLYGQLTNPIRKNIRASISAIAVKIFYNTTELNRETYTTSSPKIAALSTATWNMREGLTKTNQFDRILPIGTFSPILPAISVSDGFVYDVVLQISLTLVDDEGNNLTTAPNVIPGLYCDIIGYSSQ